jgi:hypothetical protein
MWQPEKIGVALTLALLALVSHRPEMARETAQEGSEEYVLQQGQALFRVQCAPKRTM